MLATSLVILGREHMHFDTHLQTTNKSVELSYSRLNRSYRIHLIFQLFLNRNKSCSGCIWEIN
jgi:hypothetical protein